MRANYELHDIFNPVAVQPMGEADAIRQQKVNDLAYCSTRQQQKIVVTAHKSGVSGVPKQVTARNRPGMSSRGTRGGGRRSGRFGDVMAENSLQRSIEKAIMEDSIQTAPNDEISVCSIQVQGGKAKVLVTSPSMSVKHEEVALDSILGSFASRNDDAVVFRNPNAERDESRFEMETPRKLTHNTTIPKSIDTIPSVVSSNGESNRVNRGRSATRRAKAINQRCGAAVTKHRVGEVLGDVNDATDFDKTGQSTNGAVIGTSVHAGTDEEFLRERSNSVASKKDMAIVEAGKHDQESVEKNSVRGRSRSRRSETLKEVDDAIEETMPPSSELFSREMQHAKGLKGRKVEDASSNQQVQAVSPSHSKRTISKPTMRRVTTQSRRVSKSRRRLLDEATEKEAPPPENKTPAKMRSRRVPPTSKKSHYKFHDTRYDEDDAEEEKVIPNAGNKRSDDKTNEEGAYRGKKLSDFDLEFDQYSSDSSSYYSEGRESRDTSYDGDSLSSGGRDTASRSSDEYDDDYSYDSDFSDFEREEFERSKPLKKKASKYYTKCKTKVEKTTKKVTESPEIKEVNARAEIIGKQAVWVADEISKSASSAIDKVGAISAKDVELAVERAYMNLWEWANGETEKKKESPGAMKQSSSHASVGTVISDDSGVIPTEINSKRRIGRVSRRRNFEPSVIAGPLDPVQEE